MALGELHVFDNGDAVAKALAQLFVDSAKAAIEEGDAFSVALAGGTTPRATYQLLAQEPYRSAIEWESVFVYFGDERCVPPDHPDSNYKMASDALLSHVNIPAGNVHRIEGERDPKIAASVYARGLAEELGAQPRFDLVMLGMGADGHTASLFPGTDPLTDTAELARAVYAKSVDMWRITLTPTVLNAARTVVFAVEGAAKASALASVREGASDPTTYPAQIINPTDGKLLWYVDKAATK